MRQLLNLHAALESKRQVAHDTKANGPRVSFFFFFFFVCVCFCFVF